MPYALLFFQGRFRAYWCFSLRQHIGPLGLPIYQSRIDICQHLVPWAARVAVLAPNDAAWARRAPCCYPLFSNQTGTEGHLAVLFVSSGMAEALLSLVPLSCLRAPSVDWLSGFADFSSLIPNPDAAYQCNSRLYGSPVRIGLSGRCWSETTKRPRPGRAGSPGLMTNNYMDTLPTL